MKTLICIAALASALILSSAAISGCSEEVEHHEKTTSTWSGGEKHEDTRVYKNPDGTTTVEHEKDVNNP